MGTLEDLLQIAPLNIYDEEYRHKLARELKIRGYLDKIWTFDPIVFMNLFNSIDKNQYLTHESNSTLSEDSIEERINIFRYININRVRSDVQFEVEDREDFNINWPNPSYYIISCEPVHNGEHGDFIRIIENSQSNYINIEIHRSLIKLRNRQIIQLMLHPDNREIYFSKSYISENMNLIIQFLHEFMDCERNNLSKTVYTYRHDGIF